MGSPPLTSKLHPPRRRRGHVSRAALLERIRRDDPDLLLVTAPAGYGKSTLLAELAATDGRRLAWLTLDPAHNDAGVLLGDIAFALQPVEPVDPALLTRLSLHPAAIADPVFLDFARMFGARREPFLLVIDDVHELFSLDALDALALLIAEIPPGSMLALGGRARPVLPFGRIRTEHVVAEVGPADLELDVAGTVAMCAELTIDVDEDEAARLVERTEGWPLALHLAALAPDLRRRAESAERIGDTRPMVEYFSDVFLSGLDPDIASLLLGVAPLDRFCGRLCDDVFGRVDSAAVLEDLHRRNLLVIALDDHRAWYRLHNLFAEFLSTELERRDASATRAVLLGASRWHERHGDVEAAIACAARAGEMHRTAEAADAHGRLPVGADWQPMTSLAWGAAEFMLGRDDHAAALLREAIDGGEGRPVTQAIAIAHLALLHGEHGEWDRAAELARAARVVAIDRLAHPATCLVTAAHALVLTRNGRADEALADHQMSRRHLAGLDVAAPWLNLQTRIALARASQLAGRHAEAETLADEAAALLTTVPDAVRVAEQIAALRRSAAVRTKGFGPTALTTAELRVLQYLPTHLSIAEIAERLYLSRNTVKTHTIAIYRKLGTSSRSSAVELARNAGLLS